MAGLAEMLMEFIYAQHVPPGINAACIQRIKVDKMVAHFVAGIGELNGDLLRAAGYALEADCEAVAALYRENNANVAGRELGAHIRGNIVNGGKVAVRTGHYGLRNAYDVLFVDAETFLLGRGKHAVYGDCNNVVPFADYRGADSSGNGGAHGISSVVFFAIWGRLCLFIKTRAKPFDIAGKIVYHSRVI